MRYEMRRKLFAFRCHLLLNVFEMNCAIGMNIYGRLVEGCERR